MDDKKVDWNCEFFHGENKERLLEARVSDIEPELLPKFIKALNDYLSSPGISDGYYPATRFVKEIVFSPDNTDEKDHPIKVILANGEVEGFVDCTFYDCLNYLTAVSWGADGRRLP